jgi:CDP-glycerol glycerophosphotransferase
LRIVWYSFHGRYSDNPRALYESLRGAKDLEHVWLAHPDHRSGFPLEAELVDVDSVQASKELHAADLVVANTHVEVPWRKQAGTTYVQTWHGTPLKRVHHDVLWAQPGRLDFLDEDVAKWDLLISPNHVSTTRLRHAFRYDGEVLESGYPRNDLLLSPEAEETRARVRDEFGVGPETRLVLYAPTWRDHEVLLDVAAEVPMALDAQHVLAQLPGHEMLVRVHNFVTGRSPMQTSAGVHDASYYPDVAALYTAADVLVTDYSSCMFDFAITGRPIVFYAYDLEDYASRVRGFYGDLAAEAPGPLARSQSELVDVLRSLDDQRETYAERYEAFQRRYTSLEDGHATGRVLERLGLAPGSKVSSHG